MIVALHDLYPEFGWWAEADGATSGRWIDLLIGLNHFWTVLAAFDRPRRRRFLYRR